MSGSGADRLKAGAMDGFMHATAVVVGEYGVLIRGASGAGKSALARALIAEAAVSGRFARLVGDDRVSVSAAAAPVARPHPAIAGAIEQRGEGIFATNHEPAAVLAAVIDLCDKKIERFPLDSDAYVNIAGYELPRLAVRGRGSASELVQQVFSFLDRRVPRCRS